MRELMHGMEYDLLKAASMSSFLPRQMMEKAAEIRFGFCDPDNILHCEE